MYTAEQLEQMRNVDITTVDKASLVDLSDIRIDPASSYEERMRQYLQQVKNPYAFTVSGVAVKVEFTSGGRPLKDAIKSYLTTIKNKV